MGLNKSDTDLSISILLKWRHRKILKILFVLRWDGKTEKDWSVHQAVIGENGEIELKNRKG